MEAGASRAILPSSRRLSPPPAVWAARRMLRLGGEDRTPGASPATIAAMTQPRCPVCQGETFEIRAKLLCRACGMIIETCCEGGPMGPGVSCPQPTASPARPAPTHESQRG